MGNLIDITGQRFERWVVLEKVKNPKGTSAAWLCRCDCGNTNIVVGKDLLYGKSKSCGCLRVKHGGEKTRLYKIWHNMKTRCFNPNSHAFQDYGGRGITVCEEWRDNFASFRDWAFENGYDENAERGLFTLDRIDNNGPYSPENCRWESSKAQANNRRSNHLITCRGETHTLSEWSDITGIPYPVLRNRLNALEWPIEKAIDTPAKKYNPRKN